MATKNISRTVIEGGRRHYNTYARRTSNSDHRAAQRAFSRRIMLDPNGALEPIREKVSKDFYDKLAPAERWMRRQAGRPWNKVYAEIRERFDIRTTAGRHIVFDHMLRWVRTSLDDIHYWHGDFFVDVHGILRTEALRRRRPAPPAPGIIARRRDVVRAWRSGRRVGFRGAIPFWFVVGYTNGLGQILGWRQHVRLDEKELAFFRSLDREGLREVLLGED